MVTFIVSLLLVALMIIAISLQKAYSLIPVRELKRRAQQGDIIAHVLHGAAAYGMSLRLLLWVVIGLCAAGFFVALNNLLPSWLAVLVGSVTIWYGFAWVRVSRVSDASIKIAARAAPAIIWVLNYVHPLFEQISNFIMRHESSAAWHTQLYEKDDLINLIDAQKQQEDNRIDESDLEGAIRALTYGDLLVRDITIPKRVVKLVSSADSTGPILMGELHQSGHSRFPVYDDNEDNIVGTLFMRDLVDIKSGGTVRDVMKKDVFYVHEEQNLREALQAFLKTKHHLFVVVNEYEEFVGIITIEDVIEQIIGSQIVDEFDQYDDLRAVAAKQADKQHRSRAKQEPVNSSETVVESE